MHALFPQNLGSFQRLQHRNRGKQQKETDKHCLSLSLPGHSDNSCPGWKVIKMAFSLCGFLSLNLQFLSNCEKTIRQILSEGWIMKYLASLR